jgi:hypothetical protein
MTRWIQITLFILLITLGAVTFWWFTQAPPVGGLAQ